MTLVAVLTPQPGWWHSSWRSSPAGTPVALGVIALAAVGIILLLRDWRTEQQQARFDADIEADDIEFGDGAAPRSVPTCSPRTSRRTRTVRPADARAD